MKQFKGYTEARAKANSNGSTQLEPGAYICKILAVKYEKGEQYGDRIALQFDVAQGDQKDFFKNRYENDTAEDKKWKGAVRINVPTDDGSEADGWNKTKFARWTAAFENSNTGYTWDWDEAKLKGKLVGIIFRKVGKMIDGKPVTYTEANYPCATEEVTNDKWYKKAAEFHAYKGYDQNASAPEENKAAFVSVDSTEEEIPF